MVASWQFVKEQRCNASPAIWCAAASRIWVFFATVQRWLKLPHFEAAYRQARREVVEKAVAQLQQASWAASGTLIRLLTSGSDSVRLRAAQTILDQANKGLEMMDFEERLSALEQQNEWQGEQAGENADQAAYLVGVAEPAGRSALGWGNVRSDSATAAP